MTSDEPETKILNSKLVKLKNIDVSKLSDEVQPYAKTVKVDIKGKNDSISNYCCCHQCWANYYNYS